MPKTERMTRGGLSRMTGCNIETIRYYERTGVMPQPRRSEGGHRLYDPADVRRLMFIRRCRELGFSLEKIRGLLDLADGGGHSCDEVRDMTLAHVDDIVEKIVDLRRMERILKELAAKCEGGDIPECPILEALSS
ncbi:MAG: MerR family transcriptional regulator [Alphaproteobacteria bacterium]